MAPRTNAGPQDEDQNANSDANGAASSRDQAPPTNWRSWLKAHGTAVHPAANVFELMPDAEIDDLAADIGKHGLINPITLSKDGQLLLDGRNRLKAIWQSHADAEQRDRELSRLIDNAIRIGAEVDPFAFVVSANIKRRHLTVAQKRDVIAKLLKAQPEKSDRQIAEMAKVDHKTVASARTKAEATGEIPQLEKTVGADGKARPARDHRAKAKSSTPAATIKAQVKPASTAALDRDVMIEKLSELLSSEPGRTIEDLARLIGQARIPLTDPQRIALGDKLSSALGVAVPQRPDERTLRITLDLLLATAPATAIETVADRIRFARKKKVTIAIDMPRRIAAAIDLIDALGISRLDLIDVIRHGAVEADADDAVDAAPNDSSDPAVEPVLP